MLAGAWAGFLKPPSDEAMASGGAGKKRAQTPATTAPLSKCARMALADEKRKAKEAATKAKNVEDAAAEAAAAEAEKPKPAARPISKAERLMLAEQRKQEKVEKMEKAAADKIEKAEKKAAKDAEKAATKATSNSTALKFKSSISIPRSSISESDNGREVTRDTSTSSNTRTGTDEGVPSNNVPPSAPTRRIPSSE